MTPPPQSHSHRLYSEAGRGSGIHKGNASVIGRDAQLANDFTNGNDSECRGAALNSVARPHFLEDGSSNTLGLVASDQRRKGKSMSRRSGQKGQVVRKGCMWHVRFYVDVPAQEQRQRKSVPIGPCTGKDKLTKPEAARKGAEVVASLGVNTEDHLERSMNLKPIVTFRQRVEWCRRYHKAWTDGKPSSVLSMESQLTKHILPRFGSLPLDAVNETVVQEFVADLKRATFQMRKRTATPLRPTS